MVAKSVLRFGGALASTQSPGHGGGCHWSAIGPSDNGDAMRVGRKRPRFAHAYLEQEASAPPYIPRAVSSTEASTASE
jgi:hypothetical protein